MINNIFLCSSIEAPQILLWCDQQTIESPFFFPKFVIFRLLQPPQPLFC